MKKLLALAIAIFMIAAIAVPAFAALDNVPDDNVQGPEAFGDEEGKIGDDVIVEYGVTQSYTIYIPEAVSFAASLTDVEAYVGVENAILAGNEKINVNVASATQYELTSGTKVQKAAWTMVDLAGISEPVDYWFAETTGSAKPSNFTVTAPILTVARAEGNNGIVGSQGSKTLYFNTNGTAQEGTYRDLLTFTAAISTDATGATYTPVA